MPVAFGVSAGIDVPGVLSAFSGVLQVLPSFSLPQVQIYLWVANGVISAWCWPALAALMMNITTPQDRGTYWSIASSATPVGTSPSDFLLYFFLTRQLILLSAMQLLY